MTIPIDDHHIVDATDLRFAFSIRYITSVWPIFRYCCLFDDILAVFLVTCDVLHHWNVWCSDCFTCYFKHVCCPVVLYHWYGWCLMEVMFRTIFMFDVRCRAWWLYYYCAVVAVRWRLPAATYSDCRRDIMMVNPAPVPIGWHLTTTWRPRGARPALLISMFADNATADDIAMPRRCCCLTLFIRLDCRLPTFHDCCLRCWPVAINPNILLDAWPSVCWPLPIVILTCCSRDPLFAAVFNPVRAFCWPATYSNSAHSSFFIRLRPLRICYDAPFILPFLAPFNRWRCDVTRYRYV